MGEAAGGAAARLPVMDAVKRVCQAREAAGRGMVTILCAAGVESQS